MDWKNFDAGKKYSVQERANIIFSLVYGIGILIPFTDESDKQDAADLTVGCVVKLYQEPNSNPLKKAFSTKEQFIDWFNRAFPTEEG